MDLGRLLTILRRRWRTLLIGFVVAILAAVFSGYQLGDGGLTSRSAPKFISTSRVLVIAPDQSLFAIGSQPILDPDTGVPLEIAGGYNPQELAEIYAFFVISDDMRARVESVVGELGAGESLSAARRRAGPAEAESEAPSNSVLPILEITATAPAGRRAIEVAETATDAFVSYVTEQQVAKGVLPELRVELQVLDAASGASDKSGSATGTAGIVFLGVFSAYASLAFARENRLRDAAAATGADVRWVNLVVPVGDTTGTLPTMIRELHPDDGERLATESQPEVTRRAPPSGDTPVDGDAGQGWDAPPGPTPRSEREPAGYPESSRPVLRTTHPRLKRHDPTEFADRLLEAVPADASPPERPDPPANEPEGGDPARREPSFAVRAGSAPRPRRAPSSSRQESATDWMQRGGIAVLGLVALFITQSSTPAPLAAALGGVLLFAVFHRWLVAWQRLVAILALVVLLVPMRRYALPVNLPYQLEPYRILVLLIVAAVVVSLLVDPTLHLRKLGFGGWFSLYVLIAVLSLAPNYTDIAAAAVDRKILGAVTGLLTVLLAFVAVRLVLLGQREVHALLGAIVIGGAIVGLFAIFERRTGSNPLRLLDSVLPLAKEDRSLDEIGGASRFGRLRAFGSAQHPVALGAQLVVVLPISAYLARHARWPVNPERRQQFWLVCACLIAAGLVMSVSRLAIVALTAVMVCAVRLRPEAGRTAMKVAVPVFCALLLFGGGALTDLVDSFRPSDGLIAEQSIDKSARSSGRLADIRRVGESLGEAPLLGKGSGVRSSGEDDRGRLILDNEYFGRLVDTGLLGFAAFAGLVFAPIRRTWRLARRSTADLQVSDLAAALCCSFVGFAVGLAFYDGLSFLQPVMTFALLLAVAGWLLNDVVKPTTREGAGSSNEGRLAGEAAPPQLSFSPGVPPAVVPASTE